MPTKDEKLRLCLKKGARGEFSFLFTVYRCLCIHNVYNIPSVYGGEVDKI